ncbi:MAG TPA: hypothetical protein PLM07_15965 [Candidatus Rifleibacterium sp.]|nr:hypothetical protein [Candidatus Rifleibacterium sp.]HPT47378.1 hypothetical protein [Candidatus Rifleibacterium sp.]
MRKLAVLFLMVLLSAVSVYAQDDLDQAYFKNFKPGTILVSSTAIPARAKCDVSLFDYRDGKFFIPAGAEGKLNVRALLADGATLGSALEKVKQQKNENLQYRTSDTCMYKVWCSHDQGGTPYDKVVWPTSLKDVPIWAGSTDATTSLEPEVYSWVAPGAAFEGDFRSSFWSLLLTSKPGQKLYITFHVGYEYKTPAGKTESKWNAVLQTWENVVSNGELGYVLSEPLAASTVEFK